MSAAPVPFNPPSADSAFARAVAQGLTARRKYLPASWLYDEIGSALFEVITLLPEYGLTRADASLLAVAANEIVKCAERPRLIIELGSGTGSKTRHILNAAAVSASVRYLPIDISGAALQSCSKELGGIARVSLEPIEGTYLESIDLALSHRRPFENALILFLGSTIGNFSRTDAALFLQKIRQRTRHGDTLLLGADLVKPRATLLRAYDDDAGVTAAFNLNLLARINRELDGQFDLRQFTHEARFNERHSRVEMHLRSGIAQKVKIGALDLTLTFAAGETIWTESSHKFRAEDVVKLGRRGGWECRRQWIDREWGFAETLFVAA